MIHVIATIDVYPGAREQFLREFAAVKTQVTAEDGCLEYGAAIGLDSGMTTNSEYSWAPPRADAVIIVEKWSSMETWRAHLTAPHMETYRTRTKALVLGRAVQLLVPVDEPCVARVEAESPTDSAQSALPTSRT